ncbi:MAG: hypothetical protein GXP33_16185 [Spirochaetes bacterium]|nr:hypothetical protein [Spirochaetota bacterium]
MPYLYNTAITASQTGIPLQRPLFLEFPEDSRINMEDLNYLFGDSILVPTIVSGETGSIDVYLPETAQWYDPQEALYP